VGGALSFDQLMLACAALETVVNKAAS
jgi:hypothetical protein